MAVRYDFVSIDDFLKLNPQYTKEERREILALNTSSAPVEDRNYGKTSDYGPRYERILDKEEISAFFHGNSNLTYQQIVKAQDFKITSFRGSHLNLQIKPEYLDGSGPAVDWRLELTQHIINKTNMDLMRGAFNLVGFPIEADHSLTKAPEANLNLVLDHMEKELFEDWDQTSQDGQALVDIFEATPFELEGLHVISDDSPRDFSYIKLKSNNRNKLFWKLIAPQNSHSELTLKFVHAIDMANIRFASEPIEPLSFGRNPPRIALKDFPDWFQFFREELNKPLPSPNSDEKSDLEMRQDKIFLAGLQIDESHREDFEGFLASDDFRGAYLSGSEWPFAIVQKFLTFFPDLVEKDSIRIQDDKIYRVGFEKRPMTLLYLVLLANGYKVFNTDEGVAVSRIVRTQTITQNAFIRPPKEFLTDIEPLTSTDTEIIVKSWPLLLNQTTSSNGAFTPENLMILPFLFRLDLAGGLAKLYPWLKPLIIDLGDTANEDIAEFAQIWFQMGQLVSSDTFLPHLTYWGIEGQLLPILMALNQMDNPKAGFVLLLFLALPTTSSGERLRRVLPALFSQLIRWGGSATSKSRYSSDEELPAVLNYEKEVSTNAWNEWEVSDVKKAATELTKVPEEFVKKVVSDFDNELYQSYLVMLERNYHWKEKVLFEVDPALTPDISKSDSSHDRVSKKRLLRALRLKSTRQAVSALDDRDLGFIHLGTILNLSLSGPEREDLRRALRKILQHRGPKKLKQLTLDPAIEAAEYSGHVSSMELFTATTLKKIIRHSATKNRRPLWEALFRKSEKEALELWVGALEALAKAAEEGEENKAAMEESLTYPNIDDLRNGFDFAMASENPLSKEIIATHQSLLTHYGIPVAFSQFKLGELDSFYFALDAITEAILAPFPVPSDPLTDLAPYQQWLIAVELSGFLKNNRALFPTLNVGAIRERLENWLPPYLITYVLTLSHLNNDAKEQDVSDAYEELISLLEVLLEKDIPPPDDSAPRTNSFFAIQRKENEFYYLSALKGVWKFLQQNPDLKQEQGLFERYAVVFDEVIMAGLVPIQSPELKQILIEMNNDATITEHSLPPAFFLTAMAYGLEWDFDRPSAAELFQESPEGLVFQPGETWLEGLFYLDWFQGSLISIKIFDQLRQRHGFFRFGEIDLESSDFDESDAAALEGAYRLSAFLFDGPYPRLTPGDSEILEELNYKYPESVAILKKMRLLNEADQIEFTDDIEGEPIEMPDALQSLLYPETVIEDIFYSLARFDDVHYPTDTKERDETAFRLPDIDQFGNKIGDYYEKFFYLVRTMIRLKQTGYPIHIDLDDFKSSLPQENRATPWLKYAYLLVRVISGDIETMEELWDYHEKKKELKSDTDPFDIICGQLLYLGRQILLQHDPERFFFGRNASQLANETLMGMIEFGHPNPETEILKGHLDNPQLNTEPENQAHDDHASMVAQVLLGNPGPNKPASGRVRSYIIPSESENHWKEIDKVLGDVLSDIDAGKKIQVINMSFGVSSAFAVGSDFEKLMDSDEISHVREKIDLLLKKKIPIVISAGNEGNQAYAKDSPAVLLLQFFNFFGVSDPRLIFVGATDSRPLKITPENDPMWEHRPHPRDEEIDMESLLAQERMSTFSSPGGVIARPDLSAPGEGYTLWQEEGLGENIQGTSFSSPFTARLIALMKTLNPHLSVEKIQAILKMSAQDLESAGPNWEGAGALRPKSCLYLAYAARPFRGRKSKKEFAQEIGITEQERKNLDWLGRRINRQVFFKETTKQSYAE